jgi:hypothetical protein
MKKRRNKRNKDKKNVSKRRDRVRKHEAKIAEIQSRGKGNLKREQSNLQKGNRIIWTATNDLTFVLSAKRELAKAEAGLAKSQRAYEQMRERVRHDDIVQAEYDREKKLRKEVKKAEQLAKRRSKHAKNKAKDLAKAEKVIDL